MVRKRRLGGWGFEGESLQPSQQLLGWLEDAIGPPQHPILDGAEPPPEIAAAVLPALGAESSSEPADRLAHARGQGLADVLRLRTGLVPALPDGVCRPATVDEVATVLARCADAGIRVIPWGGGTSVTGGVNVVDQPVPVVTMDLERLAGLARLDEFSGLATFGPGTPGPAVEAALAPHGLTLGHFPQSWELATVGGWIATRSAGQESLRYGRIEDMVAGLDLVAPGGRLRLPARPASASGPDLRQIALGSEGRLGVITEATLRVRPRPPSVAVECALLPELELGIGAAHGLVSSDISLNLLRLSDSAETQVALAMGLATSSASSLLRRYLALRGVGPEACLMLYGAAGDRNQIGETLAAARSVLRRFRALRLGRRPGRRWLDDRFRHPYLRESLLDHGLATDTLETAVPWSGAAALRDTVASAIAGALQADGERTAVLCHLSHPYRDGTSLYFTFFFRCAADREETLHRWATVKRAANRALISAGVTLSHHHGVGQWHAPWYEEEVGTVGRGLLVRAAAVLDPAGIMNPNVLLDQTDRLEA